MKRIEVEHVYAAEPDETISSTTGIAN